jgi:hypothetical protein
MFSNRVAFETEEKTEKIRKNNKKLILQILFPKVFQFPFSSELSRGDLIANIPYFCTQAWGSE